MKPLSKEFLEALESAPKITRSIEAAYDPTVCKTRALVTYTVDDESFTLEFDVCVGRIVDVNDVWIGHAHIPASEITFK